MHDPSAPRVTVPMRAKLLPVTAVMLTTTLVAPACASAPEAAGPRTVQPGAPGSAGGPLPDADLSGLRRPQHTEVDIHFIRSMIAHHSQALELAALAPERAEGDRLRLLARRIDVAQRDEITRMRRWLEARGEAPDIGHEWGQAATVDHSASAHGMLTVEEISSLEGLSGSAFDRRFLDVMIRHHEGALAMVADLFSSHGAGQDAAIFSLASEIDGEQRIEIERMRVMRAALD